MFAYNKMSGKREQKLREFAGSIGYRFRNWALLDEALTHASLKLKKPSSDSYERLEFIGDAVLGIVITKWIFLTHENASQGVLTEKRKELVNNALFRKLAYFNEFHEYLDFEINDLSLFLSSAKNGDIMWYRAPKVLADIFESVAGAIYVDSDYNVDKVWSVYSQFFSHLI